MNFVTKLAAIGVVSGGAVFASGAQAVPGALVISNGNPVVATFIGFSAGDTDSVSVVSGLSNFFFNKNTSQGTQVNLGSFAAGVEVPLSLENFDTPATYFSGPQSRNSDGKFHANVTTNINEIGGLTQANYTFATNFAANNPGTVFVGFEDRTPDNTFDYNDLVFAVTSGGSPVTVPEPATLALLGAGLIGLGAARRRKEA